MKNKKIITNKGIFVEGGEVIIQNSAIGPDANVNIEIKQENKQKNDLYREEVDTQNLKNLIEENRIIDCLDILKEATKSEVLDTYANEVIMYISKAKNLKKEENMGLAAREDIQINKSQLSKGILELIDEIEKEVSK